MELEQKSIKKMVLEITRTFRGQGGNYCRPEYKGIGLLRKVSRKVCKICNFRKRGKQHDSGIHHQKALRVLKHV